MHDAPPTKRRQVGAAQPDTPCQVGSLGDARSQRPQALSQHSGGPIEHACVRGCEFTSSGASWSGARAKIACSAPAATGIAGCTTTLKTTTTIALNMRSIVYDQRGVNCNPSCHRPPPWSPVRLGFASRVIATSRYTRKECDQAACYCVGDEKRLTVRLRKLEFDLIREVHGLSQNTSAPLHSQVQQLYCIIV